MARAERIGREAAAGIAPEPGQPIEAHHIRAAIRLAAFVVVTYGEVYAPILERLEAELADLERRRRPIDRAHAILEAYTLDGGMKAIR